FLSSSSTACHPHALPSFPTRRSSDLLANRTDMIRLAQVTLRRGAKTLLEGADVSLNPGDRIGLIGANGSGKSSLFALLRGELHADQGEVDYPARWRVAYVAQETPALERTALE